MSYPQINPTEPIVHVTPEAINLNVVLDKDIIVELKLKNLINEPVAFKVKTTAPDKYQVRPIQAIIPASGEETCIIVMRKMSAYPDPNQAKDVRHKFLIQSAPYNNEADLSTMWKNLETQQKMYPDRPVYHDRRITCQLRIPDATTASRTPTNSAQPASSSSSDDASEKLQLKNKEYDGLMDFSIKQNNIIKSLQATVDEKKTESSQLALTIATLEKKITELQGSLNEHVEKEASAAAVKRSNERALQEGGFLAKLKAPMEIPIFIILIIALVAFFLGAIIF